MMTLTPTALLLIKEWEQFKPQTYFDSAGVPTIGFGITKFSNGDTPAIGDEISEDEAEAELFHYIRKEVEPTLSHHFEDIPLQPNQRDALGSFIYNLGGDASKWPTLKKLVRNQAAGDAIADQLMKYRKAGGKVLIGLHRRRIAEALVWLGMAWDRATEYARQAGLENDWRDFMPQTVETPAIDAEIFEEPETPMRVKGSDPTPSTPVTMDDAQFLSAEAAGYAGTYADFMSHRTVVTTRNAIEAPKIDVKKPPKPMEDSETHRGLAKETAGKENMTLGTTLTGTAATAATVRELTRDATATVETTAPVIGGFTANHFILIGLFIGIPLFAYGAWKAFSGWRIARRGREDGTQLKV